MRVLLAAATVLLGLSGVVGRATFEPMGVVYGESGIVYPDGRLVQFTPDQVGNFVVQGPSGAVFADGNHIQFTSRKKRSPQDYAVSHKSNFGESGIVSPEGMLTQFTREEAENILLIGPSAVILKDGRSFQFTRKKRSTDLVGPSGMIVGPHHQQIQFKDPDTKIILEGPSAYILSDGQLIQKKL